MDAVPVLAGGHRHAGDREIFIQLIERRGAATSAGAGHAGADLHRLIERSAVKQAVKAGDKRRIGRRIVDGACHDEAVRLLEFRGQLIHHVVKHAFAELGAAVAGHAAAHGLIADLHGLDRNAALR